MRPLATSEHTPRSTVQGSVTDGLWCRDPLQPSGSSKTTVTEATLSKGHCCSRHSTDRAQFSSTTKQNNTQHFSRHLDNTVEGRHFHKEQGTENTFQSSMDVKHYFLHYRNKQLFSHWQKCVVLIPTLSGKYVSGPTYIIMVYSIMPI